MRKYIITVATLLLVICLGVAATSILSEQKLKSSEYKELSGVLVEVMGASSAGVTKSQFHDLHKKFLVASLKYKVALRPELDEVDLLNYIDKTMSATASIWEMDSDAGCQGDISNRDDCIKNYAQKVHKILQDHEINSSYEGIYKNQKSEGGTFVERQKHMVSALLTLVSGAVKSYFEFHGAII